MTSLDQIRRSNCLRSLSLLFAAASSYPAQSEPQRYASGTEAVALVELYTSEGCSSCPPADRWLQGLVDDAGLWTRIVPVAFHVDYWDYIGWRDPYATALHALRQRRYAELGAVSQVYTPGFVVDGQEWRGWFARQPIRPARRSPGVLTVEMIDSVRARVDFRPQAGTGEAMNVSIALLGFGLESSIDAGENAGRTLRHDFVVLGSVEVPLLRDQNGFNAEVALPPLSQPSQRLALAAWVSRADSPAPVQAVGGWLH
jgi:hypothetical protein